MVYGDGREERMQAMELEARLRADPEVTRRREEYFAQVKSAKAHAVSIGKDAIIAELVASNPAYIRDLLETEDDRFGPGSLADRYARTFYKAFKARRAAEEEA